MIVTLIPFGAITGVLVFTAVRSWTTFVHGENPVSSLGDTVWLTAFATLFLFLFSSTLIVGAVQVRKQLAAERNRASAHEEQR